MIKKIFSSRLETLLWNLKFFLAHFVCYRKLGIKQLQAGCKDLQPAFYLMFKLLALLFMEFSKGWWQDYSWRNIVQVKWEQSISGWNTMNTENNYTYQMIMLEFYLQFDLHSTLAKAPISKIKRISSSNFVTVETFCFKRVGGWTIERKYFSCTKTFLTQKFFST